VNHHQAESGRQLPRLENQIVALKAEIGPLIDSLATNQRFTQHIEARIDDKGVATEITKLQVDSQADQLEFMRFAVNYIDNLKTQCRE